MPKPNLNMSSSQSNLSKSASAEEFWCNTEFEQVNYVWTINDLFSQFEYDSTISSPKFSASTNDGYEWYLDLELEDDYDDSNSISLLVNYIGKGNNKNQNILAKYFFSILNKEQEEIYTSNIEYNVFYKDSRYEPQHDDYGWKNFLKNNKNFRKKFLQNKQTLTISFKLTFFELKGENFARMFCQCKSTHVRQLSDDLSSAFENHAFSDFTLSTKGKDHQVHKVILAARSNYFAKMFESGMKENEQNRVEITDVNEDIMEEMLKFIYTGKCENLDELAEDLLIAADRFDINDLKRICVESIYNKSLSVDNALKILILADRYDASKLKSMVIDFIVDKQSEMIQLPTWDSIMTMHPLLLNEVCKVALSRTSKTSKE